MISKRVNYIYKNTAYTHLIKLGEEIGQRYTGTSGEENARNYIFNEFLQLNYITNNQCFDFAFNDIRYFSANIIAVKPGINQNQIIIGSHYDSAPTGNGADDNASGIAVMLAVAKYVTKIKIPFTIKFIAFGAEEIKTQGSKFYQAHMSEEETNNTILMINLDSLIAGDNIYVYGNEGEKGWYREFVLKISRQLNLGIMTNVGLNCNYPYGTTGLWGDHASFAKAGIPFISFEATNWEIGRFDGYTQTVRDGQIWHTEKDTIDYIDKNYPGRIKQHLHILVSLIVILIKGIKLNYETILNDH